MRSAVERYEELHRRAADAVVRRFGDEPPTAAELVEARSDLVRDTIEAVDAEHGERGGSEDRLVLHLKDSCGDHFLDGYWPAVHFDGAGGVTDLTVES